MNTQLIIESLKKEAEKDPVFKDVAQVFAQRQRARQQVTTASLTNRMFKEGFKHRKAEYERVLRRLADLGFGSLEKDVRGQVKALKDISTSLQSIGAVAVGKSEKLTRARRRIRFSDLTLPEATAIAKSIAASVAKVDEAKGLKSAEYKKAEAERKAILIAAATPPTQAKRVIVIKEGRAIELTAEEVGLIGEILYGPQREGSA